MLTISDSERYARFSGSRPGANREFVLWALLFGSVGGIAWAIRGSNGWGGIDGVIVPGMAWGLLWYWACRCRGIDARGVPLWLGLGIAIGGEWGYGQYTAWIRGTFYVGDEVVPISPAVGYLWFVLVGIAWGAPGGVALGWLLGEKTSLCRWLVRITVPLGVALLGLTVIQLRPGWFFPHYSPEVYVTHPAFMFPPAHFLRQQAFVTQEWVVGVVLIVLYWILSRNVPTMRKTIRIMAACTTLYCAFLFFWMGRWLFFPHGGLGLFDGELGKQLSRTVYTNAQNALVVAWFIGALIVAAFQRDKATLAMGAIIGAGFGVGMVVGALWCIGYIYAPQYIDWWKMWEVTAGFNLGVLYVIAMYWALRDLDRKQSRGLTSEVSWTTGDAWVRPLASAAGIVLMWGYLYFEDGLAVGAWLGPFYLVAAGLVTLIVCRTGGPDAVRDRQRSLSLVFSVFYLLFILFHGVTSRLGVFLKLYDDAAVDQYQWPVGRLWLFLPAAVVIVAVTVYHTARILLRRTTTPEPQLDHLTLQIGELIMLIGVVGIVTIWPTEITGVYAVVLFVAMFAFTRLVFRYQEGRET